MPRPITLIITFLSLTISLLAQTDHCVVNNYNTLVTISGKKIIHQVEIELQINNGVGNKYTEINIPYSGNNKINNIEAHIETINGEIVRELKRKNITYSNAYLNSTFHSDFKVATFSLVHNRYPYILKYSYEQEFDNFISLINWDPFIEKDLRVKKASLTAELPKNLKTRNIETHVKSAQTSHTETSDIYKWEVSNASFPEREYYGPSLSTLVPNVEIVPFDFFYGIKGNSETWLSYGNWIHLLSQGLDELTESEKIKVHELCDNLSSDKEKIKALYNYMQQNTRYINVSLELGGLLPHPASYVCNNKYGDCKALSNYMMAMLKEVGINSLCADVYAGYNPVKINSQYPSQQFNHVILCVPQEKDSIWLECTSSSAPINYLGAFTQNRQVLLIEKDKSRLVTTPTLLPHQCAENYYSQLKVNSQGNADIEVRAQLQGQAFDYFESFNDGISKDKHADILDEIGFLRGVDIQAIEFDRPNKDSALITLDINASIPNLAEKMGNKLLIKPIKRFGIKLEKPEKRTQEVIINYPILKTDSICIQLPQNITKVAGLRETSFKTAHGKYHRKYWINGNQLIVKREVQIYAAKYALEQYQGFYDFTRKINGNENQKILVSY
ncbi:DUF3857 domain-containing protein [Carboxylicivirga sp. N1Y90]|uniref:DUF3857 domain-containing protein n=1 Tax=Carboxylicivirga fragile TaxID=3417571 RepID=UPI003D33235B|nr:DUF3857 domain-containing protein [Marinilabiliaceae bacterium N1Y90]